MLGTLSCEVGGAPPGAHERCHPGFRGSGRRGGGERGKPERGGTAADVHGSGAAAQVIDLGDGRGDSQRETALESLAIWVLGLPGAVVFVAWRREARLLSSVGYAWACFVHALDERGWVGCLAACWLGLRVGERSGWS